jgi:hypothetical protein
MTVACGRRILLVALLGAASVLASCAPRPQAPAEVTSGARRERYAQALDRRTHAGAMIECDATVWTTTGRTGALPGVQALLVLAAPDAFRLRVESLFGVALDLAARGDSITAYVPARRQGTAFDARRDSIGIVAPGSLAYRVWSASWQPPDAAWAAATRRESLLIVRWEEQGDSVTLEIGANGLARRVRAQRANGGEITAEYPAWMMLEGVTWPARVEFRDGAESFEVVCRINRVRFQPAINASRLAVRMPAGIRPMSWPELRRTFQHLGAP